MSVKLLNSSRVRAEFQIGLDSGAAGYAQKISQRVNTPGEASGQHGFMGAPPKPQARDGNGSLAVHRAVGRKITITNQLFESAVNIDEVDAERDQTDGWPGLIRGMGEGFGMFHIERFMTLLESGSGTTYGTGYDNVSFINTAHVLGKATNNNAVTASEVTQLNVGTAAAPTPEELVLCITGLAAYMRGFKNEQNALFNYSARKFLVVVPTNMFASGLSATYANNLASGASNALVGMKAGGFEFDIMDWPLLSATDKMYLIRADGVMARPFIHQVEKDLRIRTLDADSDYAVQTGNLLAKSDGRYGYGYGEPLHVIRGTLS